MTDHPSPPLSSPYLSLPYSPCSKTSPDHFLFHLSILLTPPSPITTSSTLLFLPYLCSGFRLSFLSLLPSVLSPSPTSQLHEVIYILNLSKSALLKLDILLMFLLLEVSSHFNMNLNLYGSLLPTYPPTSTSVYVSSLFVSIRSIIIFPFVGSKVTCF